MDSAARLINGPRVTNVGPDATEELKVHKSCGKLDDRAAARPPSLPRYRSFFGGGEYYLARSRERIFTTRLGVQDKINVGHIYIYIYI